MKLNEIKSTMVNSLSTVQSNIRLDETYFLEKQIVNLKIFIKRSKYQIIDPETSFRFLHYELNISRRVEN